MSECLPPPVWETLPPERQLVPDDRFSHIDNMCADQAGPVESPAGSGDPVSSPADQCAEAQVAEKTVIQQLRSPIVCLAVSTCADDPRGIDRRSAGVSDRLAPCGVP